MPSNVQFPFPIKGQNKNFSVSMPPQFTATDLNNVRPFDVLENRARGGQRPGLDKWGDGDGIGNGTPVVVVLSVSYMELQV